MVGLTDSTWIRSIAQTSLLDVFSFGKNELYPLTKRSFLDVYYENNNLKTDLPFFFSNTTEVLSGKRAVISPFSTENMMNIVDVNEASYRKDKQQITFGTAANLSELFPFISAAATIDSMQYVDGGYFENYGLATAYDVYKSCQKQVETLNLGKKVKIHIITAVNSVDKSKNYKNVEECLQGQYVAVPTAMYNVHFGGYSEYARKMVKSELNKSGIFYHEIAFDGSVPLTRILTKNNCNKMDSVMKKQLQKYDIQILINNIK